MHTYVYRILSRLHDRSQATQELELRDPEEGTLWDLSRKVHLLEYRRICNFVISAYELQAEPRHVEIAGSSASTNPKA